MQRRRTIILILLLSLAPAFVITQTLVALYRRSRTRLAAQWAARGERDLRAAATAGPLESAAREDLEVSERVLALDPFARGIPLRERA